MGTCTNIDDRMLSAFSRRKMLLRIENTLVRPFIANTLPMEFVNDLLQLSNFRIIGT